MPFRLLKMLCLAVCAFGCATTSGSVVTRHGHPRVEVVTGDFGSPGATGTPHRTVQVEVAGKPRTMLLDSGGGLTILSPRVAADLGCEPHGRFTAHRMNNERVDMPVCDAVTLRIASRPIEVPVAGVMDLGSLMPKELPVIDGLVSLQTFEHTPVTFDVANHLLVLESDESLAQRIAAGTPMEIRLSRPGAGVALDVFVAARSPANHEKIWLILDTGNDASLILAPHAAKALGAKCADEKSCDALALDVPGLGTQMVPVRVRELIYDGNLGVGSLGDFAITFDCAQGRVWAARKK